MPVIEALARRGAAALDRHLQGGRRARRARRRRIVRERRDRAPRRSRELAGVVADAGADVCLVHMKGEPRTMQDDPRYDDVVAEVRAFLEERLALGDSRGNRRGARLARPRDRVRQDARAQPRADPAPRRDRRDRAPGRVRRLPEAVPRQAHRPARAGAGCRDRGRERAGLRARARRCSGSTTWPRPGMPCVVASATLRP